MRAKKISDLLFIVIWIALIGSSAYQIYSIYKDGTLQLPRQTFTIPEEYNMQINGVKFQDVINNLTNSYNKSVGKLEISANKNSSEAYKLAIISLITSLAGFAAQVLSSDLRFDFLRKATSD